MKKVLDSSGKWRPVGSIMPFAPDPSDPRGVTIPFHGRYRGPHNTGIPDRSALSPPQFAKKFSTPNEVVSDQHFIGLVEVTATGVTFNRCFFESKGDFFTFNASVPTTLYDCDLYGSKYRSNLVVITGSVHAVRCHIWGGGNDLIGFGDDASYEDCYIHGNVPHYGTHSDSAQVLSGTNLAVRRCKLLAYDPVTNSALGYNAVMQLSIIFTGGGIDDFEIVDNLVDGGGFTLNGSLNVAGVSNVLIDNNRWGRHAFFGPIAPAVRVVPPHGTFTNTNVYDDTGVAV